MRRDKVYRFEKYFFLLVALANLIPLFCSHYLITLDGPAHLHNARLIANLAGHTFPALREYYFMHAYPFTNWTGHLILIFFSSFLPAWMSEKALMIIILLGLPYAFRFFVFRLGVQKSSLTYLIFPATWSQLFIFGFYNHLLGMITVFVILAIWLKEPIKMKFKNWLLLFILFAFAAASHIFTFVLALTLCGGWIAWKLFFQDENEPVKKKSTRTVSVIKKLGYLILSSLGGFIIFTFYLVFTRITHGSSFVPATITQALNDIRKMRALWVLASSEQMFTAKIFYWLGMMSLAAIVIRVYLNTRSSNGFRIFRKFRFSIEPADFFMLASILCFSMFIIYDVWFNTGLFIESRFLLLGVILWAAWIAAQKFHRAFVFISVVVVLSLNFILMSYRYEGFKSGGKQADEFIEMAGNVEQGSVIYPVNFSSNWLMNHVTNYLGADKPLVILENYECDQTYFPLQWKANKLGLKAIFDGTYPEIISKYPGTKKAYDYLLTYADKEIRHNTDQMYFRMLLARDFTKVAVSPSGLICIYRPGK